MGQASISENMAHRASAFSKPTVAVLGSHSALDICSGSRKHGLPNLVVCQLGRDKLYSKNYKVHPAGGAGSGSDTTFGCVEDVLVLDKFSDIVKKPAQDALFKRQAIFVPHRSFSVYVGYDRIEKEFEVPIFGNRWLLRAEERNTPKNQHYLLQKAGVRVPKTYAKPEDIDSLCIIKAPEAQRSYERAFFFASNYEEYRKESQRLLDSGIISPEGLKGALIEEFVLGAQFNFNFFLSPLSGELELIGIDTRRQTNLDGVLRLPAREQLKLPASVRINNIETGHIACTLRESLLEQVFEVGEKFVKAVQKEYSPGPIGPFALQGAIAPAEKGEEILIFDVSFRVPGSPGTRFTPYPAYLYGQSVSVGERIAMEIKEAQKQKRLGDIVT
ncbi:5-formaminoimidazole-4-carboxamide-1-(beta)-D-ribofuranosyl 5'-monophosphate synthetase [uncultured archaeon]|nr:5-formaminoimidazole-4-carboxamide-1-(beta)-D-ribofuranosyl 5'-monophosphate synthetase [uncultured archaeon]